jgi:hypothetical protein
MTFAAGTKLGSYEITGAIGASGVGEVYPAGHAARPQGCDPPFSTQRRQISGVFRIFRTDQEVATSRDPLLSNVFVSQNVTGWVGSR